MAVYTLNGGGVQSLSAGVTRLLVDVLVFPGNPEVGAASPTNYFHIGLLRVGVNGSYAAVRAIDAASIFIDLPAGATSLGYSLFHGSSIRVTEQFAVPLGNATRIKLRASVAVPSGGASNVLLTYTVPAARMARLDVVFAMLLAGLTDPTRIEAYVDNNLLFFVYSLGGAAAGHFAQASVINPLLVYAGEKVEFDAFNASASATTMIASLIGMEFDAASWAPT